MHASEIHSPNTESINSIDSFFMGCVLARDRQYANGTYNFLQQLSIGIVRPPRPSRLELDRLRRRRLVVPILSNFPPMNRLPGRRKNMVTSATILLCAIRHDF